MRVKGKGGSKDEGKIIQVPMGETPKIMDHYSTHMGIQYSRLLLQ